MIIIDGALRSSKSLFRRRSFCLRKIPSGEKWQLQRSAAGRGPLNTIRSLASTLDEYSQLLCSPFVPLIRSLTDDGAGDGVSEAFAVRWWRLFGGLLNIAHTLPTELTKFLVQSYKLETGEMVFQGRGRICVDVESVHRVFVLPNSCQCVKYFADKDSIKRFIKMFNITRSSHPKVNEWIQIEQLVVLYLDAFVHDVPISRCPVRANAWDTNLMNKVIKKDLISPSMFRKLQLKEQLRSTKKTPLLGGLLQSEAFVSSKAKIAMLVHDVCKLLPHRRQREKWSCSPSERRRKLFIVTLRVSSLVMHHIG
ncbi:hypothetical protein ZWY2020_035591 [Hordeum vulgare]|nr:hypothetical protein ZWY2020_035591 [Hordeum vulgare]